MGVKELWKLIEPSHEKVDFDKLSGKKFAIDLSGWVVESQKVHQAVREQPKMYLRNLFFRTSKLLMSGVLPVFVLEGKVPELKQAVMNERHGTRQGSDKGPKKNISRSRFNRVLSECQKMLKLMGLTCIKAPGEAEAMCAYLDEDNLVDGCITQDGDCFLYGAKRVYREYSATENEAQKFTIEKIEQIYKLNREKMIAIALICGCDYTKGVPKAGIQSALDFFDNHYDDNILDEMKKWKNNNDYINVGKKGKKDLKTYCQEVEDFPNEDVINEFLKRKCQMPCKIDEWSSPNGPELIQFLLNNLNWKFDETLSKVLKIVARWQILNPILNIKDKLTLNTGFLIPNKIEKTRILKSIPIYEISWNYLNKDDYLRYCLTEEDEIILDNEIKTQEPQSNVMINYSNLVVSFEENKKKIADEKIAAKKGKKKKKILTQETNNDTSPVKNTKKLRKKPEQGLKRIDEIFTNKKLTNKNKKINQIIDEEKNNIKKNPIKCKTNLNETVDVIIANFDADNDFDTDVDLNESDISTDNENIIDLDKISVDTVSPLKKIQKIQTADIIDLSIDDIPYVPLSERILL